MMMLPRRVDGAVYGRQEEQRLPRTAGDRKRLQVCRHIGSNLTLQLQSFTLKQLFSEESCSVVGLSEKMSFQLRAELSDVNSR